MVLPSRSTSFAVTATGTAPPPYSWYFNGTNRLANATNAVLTLPQAGLADAGSYSVVLTNSYGSVTSSPALLTVNSIGTQPTSQTGIAGEPATFSVSPLGKGPFTYQWQHDGTNLPNNLIRTVAGNGSGGYAGDGGPATNASLYYPYDVAVDPAGNYYIADFYNSRVRKVTPTGS